MIVTGLQARADAAGLIGWDMSVGSTSVRARRGIRATIPVKADQAAHRLKQHRAVATRFDKLAIRYEATVQIAAINDWLCPR